MRQAPPRARRAAHEYAHHHNDRSADDRPYDDAATSDHSCSGPDARRRMHESSGRPGHNPGRRGVFLTKRGRLRARAQSSPRPKLASRRSDACSRNAHRRTRSRAERGEIRRGESLPIDPARSDGVRKPSDEPVGGRAGSRSNGGQVRHICRSTHRMLAETRRRPSSAVRRSVTRRKRRSRVPIGGVVSARCSRTPSRRCSVRPASWLGCEPGIGTLTGVMVVRRRTDVHLDALAQVAAHLVRPTTIPPTCPSNDYHRFLTATRTPRGLGGQMELRHLWPRCPQRPAIARSHAGSARRRHRRSPRRHRPAARRSRRSRPGCRPSDVADGAIRGRHKHRLRCWRSSNRRTAPSHCTADLVGSSSGEHHSRFRTGASYGSSSSR